MAQALTVDVLPLVDGPARSVVTVAAKMLESLASLEARALAAEAERDRLMASLYGIVNADGMSKGDLRQRARRALSGQTPKNIATLLHKLSEATRGTDSSTSPTSPPATNEDEVRRERGRPRRKERPDGRDAQQEDAAEEARPVSERDPAQVVAALEAEMSATRSDYNEATYLVADLTRERDTAVSALAQAREEARREAIEECIKALPADEPDCGPVDHTYNYAVAVCRNRLRALATAEEKQG